MLSSKMVKGATEDLPGRAARHVLDPQGPGQRRPARVPQGVAPFGAIDDDHPGTTRQPQRRHHANPQGRSGMEGQPAHGSGRMKVGSGAFDGPYSFKSRFEEGQPATNPEELIGAAHAGCFTMVLMRSCPAGPDADANSHRRQRDARKSRRRLRHHPDRPPDRGRDSRHRQYRVPETRQDAKQNCPVSKALAGTEIHLNAVLR